MDDFKEKKEKLRQLKNKILIMPNKIEKYTKMEGYYHLLSYLYRTGNINDYQYDKYDVDDDILLKYDKMVLKATQKKINEIASISPYLYIKFSKLVEEYRKNDFCSFDIFVNDKVDSTKMYEYFEEFLNILGNDVCTLYNNMTKNGNISLSPISNCLGLCLNAISVDNPCIIINSTTQYFDFYMTLVHELGHSYQFYLQRNHHHFESFNPYLETTSLLFEKLFILFLKNKNTYRKEINNYELEDHIYFLNDISISKLLCELLIQKDIGDIDTYSLAFNLKVPINNLYKEVLKDCGYIMPNKIDLSLTEFHYSLGSIIATYFIYKAKNDFNGTWKIYKDFICDVDNYPLKEVLDEYFDVDLIKTDINKFIKNYRNR